MKKKLLLFQSRYKNMLLLGIKQSQKIAFFMSVYARYSSAAFVVNLLYIASRFL